MNPGVCAVDPDAGFIRADHRRIADCRLDALFAPDKFRGAEPRGALDRSLRNIAAEQIAHRFLRPCYRQQLIQMQVKSARENARAVLHRRFNGKRELCFGQIATILARLCRSAMLDDRQTPVLDLEDLPPEEARRLDCLKRCAASAANVSYMFDNPIRRGDHLQSHACVTGLSADL